MGTMLKATCPSCGYEKELALGGGMWDFRIERILAALPEKDREPVRESVEQHPGTLKFYRYAGVCMTCRKLCSVAGAEYTGPDGGRHFAGGVCPECGHIVRLFTEDQLRTEHIDCPVCGTVLCVAHIGDWD